MILTLQRAFIAPELLSAARLTCKARAGQRLLSLSLSLSTLERAREYVQCASTSTAGQATDFGLCPSMIDSGFVRKGTFERGFAVGRARRLARACALSPPPPAPEPTVLVRLSHVPLSPLSSCLACGPGGGPPSQHQAMGRYMSCKGQASHTCHVVPLLPAALTSHQLSRTVPWYRAAAKLIGHCISTRRASARVSRVVE